MRPGTRGARELTQQDDGPTAVYRSEAELVLFMTLALKLALTDTTPSFSGVPTTKAKRTEKPLGKAAAVAAAASVNTKKKKTAARNE